MKRLEPTSCHIPCSYPIGSKENPYKPEGNYCTHDEYAIRGSLRVKKAAEATVGHPINVDYYSTGKK